MALIFLDLETTGLAPHTDRILEVAAAAVDQQLNPYSGFASTVQPPDGIKLVMDDVVTKMHTQNGLLAELQRGEGRSLSDVGQALCAWLDGLPRNADGKTHTLAGDSVHFDLSFLRSWLPVAAGYFSHRLLDVSAFRVAREYLALPIVQSTAAHRAQADVLASIAKAKWHMSRLTP